MGRFILLSGPSCAGKGPLLDSVNRFHSRLFNGMQNVKLSNSRAPRPNEVDGVHYHFRTREEIKAFRQSDGFIVQKVHKDLQALNLEDIKAIIEDPDPDKIGFLEAFHELGAQVLKHPFLGNLKEVSTVFLSPLTKDEILDIKKERSASGLQKYIEDIMKGKLFIRNLRQAGVGLPDGLSPADLTGISLAELTVIAKVNLSPAALEDIERKAYTAYFEMRSAHKYRYVIPNHDGEGHPNWDGIERLMGDAARTLESFVSILKGRNPDYFETWGHRPLHMPGKILGSGEIPPFKTGGISRGRLEEFKKEILKREREFRPPKDAQKPIEPNLYNISADRATTSTELEWIKKTITGIKDEGLIKVLLSGMNDWEHIKAAIPGMKLPSIAAIIPDLKAWQLEAAIQVMDSKQIQAAILAMKEEWQIKTAILAMNPEQLKAAIPAMAQGQIKAAVAQMNQKQLKIAIPMMKPEQIRVAILAMKERLQIAEAFPAMGPEQIKAAFLAMDRRQIEVVVRNLKIGSDAHTLSAIAKALSSPEIIEDRIVGILRVIKRVNSGVCWIIIHQIKSATEHPEDEHGIF